MSEITFYLKKSRTANNRNNRNSRVYLKPTVHVAHQFSEYIHREDSETLADQRIYLIEYIVPF